MRVCVLRRQAHEHAKSQLRQDQEGVDPQNVTGGQPKGKLFVNLKITANITKPLNGKK